MCLGNKVGECRTVKLIGSLNPNMENKIREITINSPLGKAVYGSKVGDCVEYCVNGKIISVIIRNKSKNINELLTNSSFRK